jgi:hypothetical protein
MLFIPSFRRVVVAVDGPLMVCCYILGLFDVVMQCGANNSDGVQSEYRIIGSGRPAIMYY